MALIKCPECGHQVSDTADTCPECGFCISQYMFDEKIKQKRQSINAKPSKDDSWVEDAKHAITRGKKTSGIVLCCFLGLLVLTIILMAAAGITSIWFLLIISITGVAVCLPIFLSALGNFYKIYKAEGSTIFFYQRTKITGLLIDGEEVMTSDMFEELSGKLESGSVVHAQIVGKNDAEVWLEDFSKFEAKPNTRTKTIVNNYVTNNITKTSQRAERSDMEKILIKNAKIDALASIDPTNTEKAKEQIDIVNKLDDLD